MSLLWAPARSRLVFDGAHSIMAVQEELFEGLCCHGVAFWCHPHDVVVANGGLCEHANRPIAAWANTDIPCEWLGLGVTCNACFMCYADATLLLLVSMPSLNPGRRVLSHAPDSLTSAPACRHHNSLHVIAAGCA